MINIELNLFQLMPTNFIMQCPTQTVVVTVVYTAVLYLT